MVVKQNKYIIKNEQDYLDKIRPFFEKAVDNLAESGYNIFEISDYALNCLRPDNYMPEEVYTEYLVKKILGGARE